MHLINTRSYLDGLIRTDREANYNDFTTKPNVQRFSFRPSRRPMPIPQPDYRIYEMNKRLQQRTEESDNLWWDAFATEFFEDDAQLTLTFCLEDGPKRYSQCCCCFCMRQIRPLFVYFSFFSQSKHKAYHKFVYKLLKSAWVVCFGQDERRRQIL